MTPVARIAGPVTAWLCVGLAACTSDVDATLAFLSDDLAPSWHRTFEERTAILASATSALCAAPDVATVTAARDAWWSAREPWKRAEIAKLGPVVDLPLRLGPRIDLWPVRVDVVEELIAGDAPLDEAAFDAMGGATRGLPVVEYVLWVDGDGTAVRLAAEPRRCAFLVGAASDLHRNAGRLVEAWPDTAFGASRQDNLDTWVNRMLFTVEDVRVARLGGPLGDRSDGTPQPELAESRFSGRSVTDSVDALDGVGFAWSGPHGVGSLVRDPALVERVSALHGVAVSRVGDIPDPLTDAVVVEPEVVRRAQDALAALHTILRTEVAPALVVTVTFNDNDGD